MKQKRFLLIAFLVLVAVELAAQRHWEETESETIYRGRYSNCDYGYFVLLPDTAIGHGSKSPGSNHGIGINLSAPSDTQRISEDAKRSVWISNNYNAAGLSSLTSIADQELDLMGKRYTDFRILGRFPYRLAGLRAERVLWRATRGDEPVFGEEIAAYRPPGKAHLGDIVYTLELETIESKFKEDQEVFSRVVAGFRLTRLPLGQCNND